MVDESSIYTFQKCQRSVNCHLESARATEKERERECDFSILSVCLSAYSRFRHPLNVHTSPMSFKLFCVASLFFVSISSKTGVVFSSFAHRISLLRKILGEQLQAPIILRESSDNDVPLGSRKVFTCNAIGYPPPTYMWLREWENLTSNFSALSYFEIPSARRQDQGSYRCLAKNDVGIVASKAARLTVWYFDGLLNDPGDQFVNAYESDAVILRLPSIGSSPEPSVQWFMKSSSSSRDQTRIVINDKYFITSAHNLVILNSEYQDERIYFAMIENIFVGGTKQSPDYRLQVNRRKSSSFVNMPELIVRPVDQLATVGDAIKSFECLGNAGSGSALEIIWQKNAVMIDQTNGRFHIGPYNRTLEVRGITAEDQGIYSCHVRVRNTDAFVNASAQLIVRGVPMITTNFPLILNVDLQEQVVFTCNGTRVSSEVNVTWYKNAVRVTNQSARYG